MSSRKSLYFVPAALGISAAMILSTGCNHETAQQGGGAPPAQTVTVAPVVQQEIVEWSEFTGKSDAVESVEVRPRVSGYIQEVRFQSGQMVKKGDVLFVIDPRWQQADFDQHQAEVNRAKVDADNAKREADRMSGLLASKAISQEEADTRVAKYEMAKAALTSAEATRDFMKLDLDYTEVRSPIDGRVSRALLTPGNYVSGIAGAASLLTTVVSVNPVYVYVDVDEDSYLKFNKLAAEKKLEMDSQGRYPVEMELGDEEGFPHKGYIESFDNHLDSNTGSIVLRTVFNNDDGRVVPGLFARIRVPISEKHEALFISERAIGTDQAQKYVLALSPSNTLAYTAVTLGPVIDGKRVVRTGLKLGEKVVVNGLARVRPGMTVAPQEEVASAESSVKVAVH